MNTNKKVVCVKDIPSNLIEEAIFILKSDVTETENEKINLTRREIIMRETEDLVREYEDEFDSIELVENEDDNMITSNFKLKIVLMGVLFACVGYLISLII